MASKSKTGPSPGEGGPGSPSSASEGRSSSGAGAEPKDGETLETGKIIRGVFDIPEVKQYADRIGAEHRGLRKIVVRERIGRYWRDIAVIRFSETGEITASAEEYEPSEAEQAAILAVWSRYSWPTYEPFLWKGQSLPHDPGRFPFQRTEADGLFEYWDEAREILEMVEERVEHEDGSKDFYPWTYWSDKVWRIAEPDKLPLYNKPAIADASTIIVHEGAKSAREVHRLVEDDGTYAAGSAHRSGGWRDHPWGETLRGTRLGAVAHIGWTGGAQRARATDFGPLRRSGKRIIFVADNDRDGIDAISEISRISRLKMEAVIFNDEWPDGFDLADPFPPDRIEADTRMESLLIPATWATEVHYTGRRPSYSMRPEAIGEWLWTVSPPLFFHSASPGRGFTEAEVDAMLRPFSDADGTARLIRQNLSARADGVAYLPGDKRVVERDGWRQVNLWVPSRLQEREGSAWPFARILVSRLTDRADRRHAIKWGATLRARPKTRIEHAILLQSEMQGTGKTTLATIAAEMVGEENVSRPNENILTDGSFNSHFAKKRLVIVDEIYSGHSRKTYNRLKSPITDKKLRVNEKYQPEYEIDAFMHFIFSSNDQIAMLIDNTDRRFFVPRMAETGLPPEVWRAFYAWLYSGGLGIVARCAREWVEKYGAVHPGEAAPMSAAKAEMVERSKSFAMKLAREAVVAIAEYGNEDGGQRVAVSLKGFRAWYRSTCRSRDEKPLNDNRLDQELARAGLFVRKREGTNGPDHRVKIEGRNTSIITNFDADLFDKPQDAVRSALKSMDDLGIEEEPL
ncbi:DUF5906 domain-containing protein [Qipengyuania nanhaisediminis]|uniref:primase-helicase family protein n=1 Tax=Qipengyuania nanhaisediminis TaxID=604088 RepID=UPI0038B3D905